MEEYLSSIPKEDPTYWENEWKNDLQQPIPEVHTVYQKTYLRGNPDFDKIYREVSSGRK